jgi:8-oxo-dGTP pyrophosphatase MutT (NUDIX family)
MSKSSIDLSAGGQQNLFCMAAADKLLAFPSDYLSEYTAIAGTAAEITPRHAAGVLLPILRRPQDSGGPVRLEELFFQLIKRSSLVSQPGDLSCPGGMLRPRLDRLLGMLLCYGHFPVSGYTGVRYGNGGEKALRRLIFLFLANALREAWEEIHLSPFHVRLLGPLPTYSLALFRRTIFPLAGYVTQPWKPKLNDEVDKIVEVPLTFFLDPAKFGCFRLIVPDPVDPAKLSPQQRPCLILSSPDGGEEILWGATLTIIVQFLSITMDYRLPEWHRGRTIERQLRPDYLTGQSHSQSLFRLTGTGGSE